MDFNALSLKDILTFSVLGSIITALGTLIGLLIKETLLARSFERWKQERSLDEVYRLYRHPLALAAAELATRCKEICSNDGKLYMRQSVLRLKPARPAKAWTTDSHYRQHKLHSTVFRFCSLFGWIELYRQRIVFLGDPKNKKVQVLESAIDDLREALADGALNMEKDWSSWHDSLLFREELRAIGESMIVKKDSGSTVMGFKEFLDLRTGENINESSRVWFDMAQDFLLDIDEIEKDFRLHRIRLLYVRLISLCELLTPSRVTRRHKDRRAEFLRLLPSYLARKLTPDEKQMAVDRMFIDTGVRTGNLPPISSEALPPV